MRYEHEIVTHRDKNDPCCCNNSECGKELGMHWHITTASGTRACGHCGREWVTDQYDRPLVKNPGGDWEFLRQTAEEEQQ